VCDDWRFHQVNENKRCDLPRQARDKGRETGTKRLAFGFWFVLFFVLQVSSDMTMRVWDLQSPGMAAKEFTELRMVGHTDWVLSCRAFVENGVTKALSSSRDHTLRLWNPDKGECLRVFHGKNTPLLRHFFI
jgi:WD40 repeat protein